MIDTPLRKAARVGTTVVAGTVVLGGAPATAASYLDEVVKFTGQVVFLQGKAPGLVIGAVRGDEAAVFGIGETARGSDKEPDGDTLVRIGSITKVLTGEVMREGAPY